MGYHGHFENAKPKKRGKKIGLIILIVILVLVIGAVVAGAIFYNSVLNKMNHVNVPKVQYGTEATEPVTEMTEATAETEGTTAETTEPIHVPSSEDYINILVVGQASRAGDVERFADTAILCTINTYEKKLTMTSFLRDALVRPPNYKGHEFGKIKLTTVYHLGSTYSNGDISGSMELMNMTLYDTFGVEVDHNFEVSFDIVIALIDALDGVAIELTQEEADYLNDPKQDAWVPYDVKPGWNWMDGSGALCYARMRKAEGDGESDIKRTARQQTLINNIIFHMNEMDPSDLMNVINEVLPMITTSMTNKEITDMAMMLLPMLPELTIERGGTCPVKGTYEGEMRDIYNNGEYHSVLVFDAGQQKKLMREITEGEIAE